MSSDAEILGRNVKRIRREYGATTYDLSEVARILGLTTWTSSAISQIEGGKYKATIGNAIALSAVLSYIAGQPIGLSDLLEAESVAVADGITLPKQGLERWLAGGISLDDFGTKLREIAEFIGYLARKPGRSRPGGSAIPFNSHSGLVLCEL